MESAASANVPWAPQSFGHPQTQPYTAQQIGHPMFEDVLQLVHLGSHQQDLPHVISDLVSYLADTKYDM